MAKHKVVPQPRQLRPLSGTPTNANGQAAGMMPDVKRGIFSRLSRFISKLWQGLSSPFRADVDVASAPAKPAVNRLSPYRAAASEAAAKPAQVGTACELCGRGEPLSAQLRLCAVCAEAITRLFLIAPDVPIDQAEYQPDDQPRREESSGKDLTWMRQMW